VQPRRVQEVKLSEIDHDPLKASRLNAIQLGLENPDGRDIELPEELHDHARVALPRLKRKDLLSTF
jgi:hypothetical protein